MLFESLLLFTTLASAALPPIEIKGNAFFDSESNDRFYIRGVDYQPGGSSDFRDPLANITSCTRDVPGFKNLGINTVRVYNVDNSADHDACMKLLDDAGIYVILDVNTPENSISRSNPGPSYNAPYLQHVFATIDTFKSYDNVLGFFAANEVINSANTTESATYVKAVIRDMKNYIQKQSTRAIPVGYSVADVAENRFQQIEYFDCGDDEMARADMIGVNDYSWCGDSSYTVSGYNQKVAQYQDISIPLFLSEFGCNLVTPRQFTEIGAIYSTEMTSVFSGGLVYEYTQEENDYGLVNITQNASGNDTVVFLQDYTNLKAQYSSVSNPTGDGGYKANGTAAACPTSQSGVWEADTSLPSMPSSASVYMTSGAGKALGTDVPSTQWGDDSKEESNDSSSPSSMATSAASTKASSGAASSVLASASASASASTSKGAAGSGNADLLNNSKTNGIVLGSLSAVIAIVFGFAGF